MLMVGIWVDWTASLTVLSWEARRVAHSADWKVAGKVYYLVAMTVAK